MSEYTLHPRFPVATICGSMRRFDDQVKMWSAALTSAGYIVLAPFVCVAEGSRVKQMLDLMHRQKIDMADIVVVVDTDRYGEEVPEEEQYVGESTQGEINYAAKIGKGIFRASDGWTP